MNRKDLHELARSFLPPCDILIDNTSAIPQESAEMDGTTFTQVLSSCQDNWPARDPVGRSRELRAKATQLYLDEEQRKQFHTSFTFFPKLPIELKTMIFKLAKPSPQIIPVEVLITQNAPCDKPQDDTDAFWAFCTDEESARGKLPRGLIDIRRSTEAFVSGLYGACQLSRELMLKTHNSTIEASGKIIRFDGANDVIAIGLGKNHHIGFAFPGYSVNLDYSPFFAGVQNLALHEEAVVNNYQSTEHIAWVIAQFRNVKEVSVLTTAWWSAFEKKGECSWKMDVAGNFVHPFALQSYRYTCLEQLEHEHDCESGMIDYLHEGFDLLEKDKRMKGWKRPIAEFKSLPFNPFRKVKTLGCGVEDGKREVVVID